MTETDQINLTEGVLYMRSDGPLLLVEAVLRNKTLAVYRQGKVLIPTEVLVDYLTDALVDAQHHYEA
jgi:hypothetical protein